MGVIYLSFDDGPNSVTPKVLNILAKYNIKATFYLNGNRGADYYSLIKRMIKEGHAIGNHGYDHDPMTPYGYKHSKPSAVEKDFIRCHEKLEKIFKSKKDKFPGFTTARLPGSGRQFSAYTSMITKKIGLPHVGWNMEFGPNKKFGHLTAHDWQGLRINEKLKGVKGNGVGASHARFPVSTEIVLYHEHHWDTNALINLFERHIKKLKSKNYEFRTLDPPPKNHSQVKFP